jgi:hypothetical protein
MTELDSANHIFRHVGGGSIHDDFIEPAAFRRKKLKDGTLEKALSVNWLEYFQGDTGNAQGRHVTLIATLFRRDIEHTLAIVRSWLRTPTRMNPETGECLKATHSIFLTQHSPPPRLERVSMSDLLALWIGERKPPPLAGFRTARQRVHRTMLPNSMRGWPRVSAKASR